MKKLRPYIFEMLIFLFSISGVVAGLIAGKIITIRIHLLSVSAILILSLLLLWCFCNVVKRGLYALIDTALRLSVMDRGRIITVYPIQGGSFTEKATGTGPFTNDQRYMFVIKVACGKTISLLSNEYIETDPDKIYDVEYSKLSKILLKIE